LDGLENHPSLELVLEANRYGEELGFSEDEARVELQGALTRLEVIRRERELESLRVTGLASLESRVEYQKKLKEFSLLRGAVRPEPIVH
jgi:hypothetical protein